jgi:hypothetical protein
MILKLTYMRTLLFLLFTSPLLAQTPPIPQKITPAAITLLQGELNSSPPSKTFDGNIGTGWFGGWNWAFYPVRCRIDFGNTYNLTHVKIYDFTGHQIVLQMWKMSSFNSSLNVYPTPSLEITLEYYQLWRDLSLGLNDTRYIDIVMTIPNGNPVPEIEFWGVPAQGFIPPYIRSIHDELCEDVFDFKK